MATNFNKINFYILRYEKRRVPVSTKNWKGISNAKKRVLLESKMPILFRKSNQMSPKRDWK